MFHIPYQNKSLMNNRNKLVISRHFVFGVNIIDNIWNFAFNSKNNICLCQVTLVHTDLYYGMLSMTYSSLYSHRMVLNFNFKLHINSKTKCLPRVFEI